MTWTGAPRGRVVMLVDNNVTHDSRVQKQAKSMAGFGWDVILLGRNTDKLKSNIWKLGDAEVRLISMAAPLGSRRDRLRRAPLRSPLAYPPGRLGGYKVQLARARIIDLTYRQNALSANKSTGAPLRRVGLAMRLWAARRRSSWVEFRQARTLSLLSHRIAADGLTDRFMTGFWQRVLGKHAWRRLDLGHWDWELAYGKVIDRLKPDLIHANDARMLAIGARAATRAKANGRNVKLVWDAHEYTIGRLAKGDRNRALIGMAGMEKEFGCFADAVVTVSEPLADILVAEHGLSERPAVVLNAPVVDDEPIEDPVPDVRAQMGLADDVPLMVYSGGAAPVRGIGVIVESLPFLEGVHFGLVTKKSDERHIRPIVERAEELGVIDRLHIVDYVPVRQIVPFLSSGTFGVHPLIHLPNHEISLATKFYEYSHARLPILGSDVKTMAATIRATGQGEVFTVGNLEEFIAGAKAILADRARYTKVYDQPGILDTWTWEHQAEVLDSVYSRLLNK